MGRGRQKAKHMKVARRLKYYSPDTDLSALQMELSGGERDSPPPAVESDSEDHYWDDTPASSGWETSEWDDDEDD